MLANSWLELITPVAAPLEGVVVSSETPHEGEYMVREMVSSVIVGLNIFYLYNCHKHINKEDI